MSKTTKVNSTDSGNIAEHLVLAELMKRNYIAVRTERNTANFDIIACNNKGTKFAIIQVKSSQSCNENKMQFRLTDKNEKYDPNQTNCYYVFVALENNKIDKTKFYIVSAEEVAKQSKENYDRWMAQPKRDGGTHQETTMRDYVVPQNAKESNFEDLNLD